MQLLSTKTQQIEWRRDQVLELSSQGLTQSEIATVLRVDKSIIGRDVAYPRQQAQENLKYHIQNKLPEEYQKCMVGINQVLKRCWSIVSKDIDNKTKLDALRLINDCNKYKMDLSANAGIVSDAMKYVTQTQEKLTTLKVLEERTTQQQADEEQGEETTTGIF